MQASAGEECDDGADNSDAGACLPSCATARCGDGELGPGEQCDDGNTQDGDGCSRECTSEGAVCGDGVVDADEKCDDGNASDSDDCTNACRPALCGDEIVHTGVEQCDDGNMKDGDGCSSQCTLESDCGDGEIAPGEECDDGNSEAGDGCSPLCKKESRRVFVTSNIFSGSLGGLAGADNKCQKAASEAKLPGTFRAWLSDDNTSPAQFFVKSAVPYVRVDDVVIAQNWDDLTDGTLDAPISLTQNAIEPNAGNHNCSLENVPIVWTNTDAQGNRIPDYGDCGGWTGSQAAKGTTWGCPNRVDTRWTSDCGGGNCLFQASLYCFEQ